VSVPALAATRASIASAYDKKAFEWTGFVEARPRTAVAASGLRRPCACSTPAKPGAARTGWVRRGRAVGGAAPSVAQLQLHRSCQLARRAARLRRRQPQFEAYGAWQIDERLNVQLGKRALRWGKGYAWSPVAFLERPRIPTDPELAREGFVMATGAWVRSFEGPLQTLALTAAVVPTTASLNTGLRRRCAERGT
jgi:hypothetical protein